MTVTGTTRAWRLLDLLRAANISCRAQTAGFDPLVQRLSVDSRDVSEGTCFVALKGAHADGHEHVEAALAAGASAVIVEAGRFEGDCAEAVFVPDTHEAVAKLAAAFFGVDRAQREGRLTLIGVTGTNGKTTVCALIRSILEAAGLKTACLGTIANRVGERVASSSMTTLPPIELCAWLADAVREGASHAVMEVSSHALDQRRCAGLDFRVGVFTNLTQDHLDYHGDLSAYARSKRRLFDALDASAIAVVCADDPYGEDMVSSSAARVMRFGLSTGGSGEIRKPDVFARALRLGLESSRFELCMDGHSSLLSTRLIGRHNVYNMIAAAGAAGALGVPRAAIEQGLARSGRVRGRLERVEATAPFSIFVDYAHTPDALKNVLELLREVARGRIICVFGCGGDRDRGKRPLMGGLAASLADVAIVTSDNPRHEDPESIIDEVMTGMRGGSRALVLREADRRKAIARAAELARPGDVVLIAGKGHEDYQVVGSARRPFDDVSVAAEVVREMEGILS